VYFVLKRFCCGWIVRALLKSAWQFNRISSWHRQARRHSSPAHRLESDGNWPGYAHKRVITSFWWQEVRRGCSSAARQFLFGQLESESIAIDVLVNNAGYGKLGAFADIPYEESAGQIELNITALTHLTKLFLAPMLQRKSGRILNVASTAGFQPGPLMAVYYASKAYVISFSEALANEVHGTGVTVTCLCPGLTDTEFQTRAGTERTTLFRRTRPMDAATVARDGFRALLKGKPLVISGMRNRLLMESLRISPRRVVTAVSRKFLE
jgi:short-subunit dehydrogenase